MAHSSDNRFQTQQRNNESVWIQSSDHVIQSFGRCTELWSMNIAPCESRSEVSWMSGGGHSTCFVTVCKSGSERLDRRLSMHALPASADALLLWSCPWSRGPMDDQWHAHRRAEHGDPTVHGDRCCTTRARKNQKGQKEEKRRRPGHHSLTGQCDFLQVSWSNKAQALTV